MDSTLAFSLDNNSGAPPLELGVAAFASVEAARSTIPDLRNKLNRDHELAPSLFKYAEEQTVLSLAAVLNAIRDFGMKDRTFTDWGVVSGPRFLGREPAAKLLDKFHLQGALGASPLIPAYMSLHAVSGTISMVLHSHGPNLGAGGSQGNMMEALLTGLAMQQEQSLPGVWVTVSEWDPEPIPGDTNQQPEPICRAVSLALTPVAADHHGLKLRLFPNGTAQDNLLAHPPTIAGLAQFLANGSDPSLTGTWSGALPGNGRLELIPAALAASPAKPARAA